jgi:hypothetical protein
VKRTFLSSSSAYFSPSNQIIFLTVFYLQEKSILNLQSVHKEASVLKKKVVTCALDYEKHFLGIAILFFNFFCQFFFVKSQFKGLIFWKKKVFEEKKISSNTSKDKKTCLFDCNQ